jgi:hypothetical protein
MERALSAAGDPVDDGADFRYRLYGAVATVSRGRDRNRVRHSGHDDSASPAIVPYLAASLYTLRHPARAPRAPGSAWCPSSARRRVPFRSATPTDHLGEAIRPQF